MALLFVDGFDAGDAVAKWNPGATGSSNATTPYGTGLSWYMSDTNQIKKSFAASSQIFLGFSYQAGNSGMQGYDFVRLFGDAGVTQHLSLRFTGANTLALYRGAVQIASGSATDPVGTWAYIEISATLNETTGTCNVLVNGAPVITFTGDTKNGGTSTNLDAFSLQGTSLGMIQVDNLYLCNSTGSAPHNTFLGEVRIQTITPNGAGTTTQFTPSAGANYAAVDELPYSSTDYVSATPAGTRDTYAMSDLSGSYNILALQNNVIAKKLDAGGTAIKPAIVSSSTVYYGTSVPITATDMTITDVRMVDPATSAAWTISGVNAIEVGMEIA
jgi:hypothetical protein